MKEFVGESKQFECEICHTFFKAKRYFADHMKGHEKINFYVTLAMQPTAIGHH